MCGQGKNWRDELLIRGQTSAKFYSNGYIRQCNVKRVASVKAGVHLHVRTLNYTYGLGDEAELDGRTESRLQFYCQTYKKLTATAGLAINFESLSMRQIGRTDRTCK